MHEAQLIEAVRYSGGFKTDDPDYGDERVLRELNETMLSTFSRVVVSSTEGYWKQNRTWPITSGTRDYQIFHRASVGGLVTVEVRQSSTSDFYPLTRASQSDAAGMDAVSDAPTHYQEFHDHIRLHPTPNVSGWSLRLWYYVRPSRLVESQTAGLVTGVNTSTRTITMNALPIDKLTGVELIDGIEAADLYIDVISPVGIHALHLVEAEVDSATEAPSATIVLPSSNPDGSEVDMTRVKEGDYVRIAGQAEWPALPQEFHQTLADAAASAILMRQGVGDRARMLSEKVQSDLLRMQDLIDPRIKQSPRWLKHKHGPLAGRLRNRRWAR